MEFREVIAYNENLINGSVETLEKKKPLNSIKGVATIELFNSTTGEKVYKAQTENVINNSVGKLIFWDCFYRRLKNKGGIDSTYIKLPFKRLYLSDYTGVEDATQKLFKGDMVGWADKDDPYSGSNTTQGTINLGETISEFMPDGKIRMHFVFDFPTHAANGTFQTIYWQQGISVNSLYPMQVNIFNTSVVEDKYSVICEYVNYSCSDYENTGYYLYSRNISSVYYRVFRSFNLDNSTNKQVEYMHFYKEDGSKMTDSDSVNGMCADNEYLYLYYISTSSINIYKFQLDGTWVDKVTIAATKYKNLSGVTPALRSFSIIEGVPYMTISYTISGNVENHLIKLDGSYNIIHDIMIDTPNGQASSWYIKLEGKTKDYWVMIDSGNKYYFYDKEFNIILSNLSMDTAITSGTKRYFFSKNHSYAYCIVYSRPASTYYYTYYVFGPTRIGAQTLLAAPVTKTPTNTMKIQYDFIIDNLLDGIY